MIVMDEKQPSDESFFPLGGLEPHRNLLIQPPDGQLLYKMMRGEDFLRSVSESYLHFTRVDSYTDVHDGQQLPEDHHVNTSVKFAKAPNFSAADYYDTSRSRTYACCFSLENSRYIWEHYGNSSVKGKVCVVFNFARLRAALNKTFENSAPLYNDLPCRQMFSLNYGVVEYVEWDKLQANGMHLPNPIKYTYLKNKTPYEEEKELRISLSALGVGKFVLNDGTQIEFPASMPVAFDFRAAGAAGSFRKFCAHRTATKISCDPNC